MKKHDPRPARIARARELRRNATVGEQRLWRQLRNRSTGFKFRRQHPIGPYVADFCCEQCRLVVEVDGDSHSGSKEHDANRAAWLEETGYCVIRFDDRYVRDYPVETAEEIQRMCRSILGEERER